MTLSFIVAMTRGEQVIGKNNTLPWKLPEDLRYFKKVTQGHPIIMGRKTYESIGRPLPGRRNIVLSRNSGLKIEGVECFDNLDTALASIESKESESFIIGGEEIFKISLPLAQKLYITWIDKKFEGDSFFPEIPFDDFRLLSEEPKLDPFSHTYAVYERIMAGS